MELNPYAGPLGDRNAEFVLPQTPELLHQVICAMTPEQIETPLAPGKWSPREIVAHLADCELAFGFRLRQVLAEDKPTIQPFNQTAWGTRYANYDLVSGLALFRAAREWNVKLVDGLSASDLQREAIHPERGAITFQIILETMAGHDLHHLAQLPH